MQHRKDERDGHAKGLWGGERAGLTVTGKIDHRDFGRTRNQALEADGILIGNEPSRRKEDKRDS